MIAIKQAIVVFSLPFKWIIRLSVLCFLKFYPNKRGSVYGNYMGHSSIVCKQLSK